MNCPSCLPQLPLPPPSNVPPLLYPPPPPLSSTPPPPLSSTPPTPRRRTPRSSKGRWYKSNVATGSAISLSSVSFVGVFVVIYRQFFKPEKDEDLTVSGTIKVSGKVSITISPPTPPPSSANGSKNTMLRQLRLRLHAVKKNMPRQLRPRQLYSSIPRYALSIAIQFVFTP
uniref:Uncharacterized protein n=1 Tax=Fagus sylvatica TaxID=28930 RepID=A0A2N9J576_FAGSY